MMTFKQYMENLWGEIPWPYKKPSDGRGGLATNPSKTDNGGSGMGGMDGSGMGAPPAGNAPMMMRKHMRKKMKKK